MDCISVIVPIYNSERYLDHCIKSIVMQTFQNLEIILIDDGSTDQSGFICDNWAKKDQRIKVVHQENKGISFSRNVGLQCATGDGILMVDSDDYIASQMIERMHDVLDRYHTELVICNMEKGNLEDYQFQEKTNDEVEIIDNETALHRIYESKYKELLYVVPWAKLYKRELFQNLQYPNGKIFEDIYLTHEILFKCKKIAIVPEKMIYYYQHEESIMNQRFNVKKLDYLSALENRIAFFDLHRLDDLKEKAYDVYLHSLIWEYSRARDILTSKDIMKDIHNRFRRAYIQGYASKRYPEETKLFLKIFNINPELIVLYWRIKSKIVK